MREHLKSIEPPDGRVGLRDRDELDNETVRLRILHKVVRQDSGWLLDIGISLAPRSQKRDQLTERRCGPIERRRVTPLD
jgi:hypothetical protein